MKKKSKKKEAKLQTVVAKKEEATIQATEKTFDFGGLPDRDLKENLGCG
jgi:hypothetical protein